MKDTKLEEMQKKSVNEVGWAIANEIRGSVDRDLPACVFGVAYVLYLISQVNNPYFDNLNEFVGSSIDNDDVKTFVKEVLARTGWSNKSSLSVRFDSETIKAFILFGEVPDIASREHGEHSTPPSLCNLAVRLLDIAPTDKVADLGAGIGNFLVEAYSDQPNAKYSGCEINTFAKDIATLRAILLGQNVSILQQDMFDFAESGKDFDKVFMNYPLGMKVRDLRGGQGYLDRIKNEQPNIGKMVSADWLFNLLSLNSISDNGKAITIMSNGSTWNSSGAEIRRYLVSKGLIEAVIALPGRLFPMTSVQTSLVVFSHNNKSIRMVDASETYQKGRRQNFFTEEHLDEILKMYRDDSEKSRSVSPAELLENEYVINPQRYFGEITVEDGVPLGELIKSVTRGAPIKASSLDEIVSEEPTEFQYLMLSNIQDGNIDVNLPFLKEIDATQEKYCLKDNDLLISKNGKPVKVAVACVPEGHKILANGNLYIMALDTSRIEPYYVKAYLDSEQGAAALNRIIMGSTIPHIPLGSLKDLMIPLKPLEEQRSIAQRYLAKLDEIEVLKFQIAKARNSLKDIFHLEA